MGSIYEAAIQRAWADEHNAWLDSKRVGRLGIAFAVPRSEHEQTLIEERTRDLGKLQLHPLLHDGRAPDCERMYRPRYFALNGDGARRCHACTLARREHDASDEDRS